MDDSIHEFSIRMPPDEHGYTGRECPKCLRYFKIKFGTGIQEQIPCFCPYCGNRAPHDHFWTQAQLNYGQSIALNQVSTDFLQRLKKLERHPDPRAFFSIGIEVNGQPIPVEHYSEKDLEQRVTCVGCSLQYAIYGVFAFCPDCGVHNSLQILCSNVAVTKSLLSLARTLDSSLSQQLVEGALKDLVSAFDGFGREVCRVRANADKTGSELPNLRFQNISAARNVLLTQLAVDIAHSFHPDEWKFIEYCFQIRHLLSHKMGVIDQVFVDNTGVSQALLGRRVNVNSHDVQRFAELTGRLGHILHSSLLRSKP